MKVLKYLLPLLFLSSCMVDTELNDRHKFMRSLPADTVINISQSIYAERFVVSANYPQRSKIQGWIQYSYDQIGGKRLILSYDHYYFDDVLLLN